MLMRINPFREFDRLVQQVAGATQGTWARPTAMPMDAYREVGTFTVCLDLPGVALHRSISMLSATCSLCGPSGVSQPWPRVSRCRSSNVRAPAPRPSTRTGGGAARLEPDLDRVRVEAEDRPGPTPRRGQLVDGEPAHDDVRRGRCGRRTVARPKSRARASSDSAANMVTAAWRWAGWPNHWSPTSPSPARTATSWRSTDRCYSRDGRSRGRSSW